MDPSWQSLQLCTDFTDLWMVLIIYCKCMDVMDRVVDEQKNMLWGFRWCEMSLHVYEQIGFLRFLWMSMHIYTHDVGVEPFRPNCLLCMNYGFLQCEYWDALIHMKVIIVEVCCIMYLSCLCVMMLLSFDKQFIFLVNKIEDHTTWGMLWGQIEVLTSSWFLTILGFLWSF
jgi:hypothetical protein